MLRNAKQVEGYALRARDGEIGHVRDFYFDDHHWHIRYLVVDTGMWLKHRYVLISPEAIGATDRAFKIFPVNLTMDQVRHSPSIDTAKPVSRQHEETLRHYYGWPLYWGGIFAEGGMAGPIMAPTPAANTSEPGFTDGDAPLRRKNDPFLRSVNDTIGQHLQALDGEIGHIADFLIDENGWRIRYFVIDTRNWWPGRKVVLAPSWIHDVSWERRTLRVDLTRSAIKASPPYDSTASWTPEYAAKLHDHYARAHYEDWEPTKHPH